MDAFIYKCPKRETIKPEKERQRIDNLYVGGALYKDSIPTFNAGGLLFHFNKYMIFRLTKCNLHEVSLSYKLQADVELSPN